MSNEFVQWTNTLKREQIDIWRESLAHLRQLHNDVWNGVKFFLTINGILFAAIAALLRDAKEVRHTLIIAISIIGVVVTVIAWQILARHREYYLQMLIRKTLIEDALGFSKKLLMGVDIVFPWSPLSSPKEICSNPKVWLAAQVRRRGTISRKLFLIYEGTVAAHILIAATASMNIFSVAPPVASVKVAPQAVFPIHNISPSASAPIESNMASHPSSRKP